MKKIIILSNFLLLNLVLLAQNEYFLFLESDNNQPYYVQTNGKTLSSSSIGHLIIPGLKDSIYTVNIGFPKNQFPEQVFQMRVGKKDAGYQLKNLGFEGWGLINLQTSHLVKGQVVESKKQTVTYGDIKKTDVFSTLMAGLVNDSAVLYSSIVKVEPVEENSQTSLSDTPTGTTKKVDVSFKDSAVLLTRTVDAQNSGIDLITKTQVSEREATSKIDTLDAEVDVLKQSGSLKDKSPTIAKDNKVGTDSSRASQDIHRENDFSRDTVLVKKEIKKEIETRKDFPELKDVSVKKSPVTTDQPPTIDSGKKVQPGSDFKAPLFPSKPLIVRVSETKKSAGTEMIFFDQSSAGIVDTIKILILKEEPTTTEPGIINEELQGKQDQKNDSGGFFGKIFGKKKKSKAAISKSEPKPGSAQNSATIKVSTVETTKPVDSPVVKNNRSKKNQQVSAKRDSNDSKAVEDKSSDRTFFGKIFGKKNKEKSSNENIPDKSRTSDNTSVKVTTVESAPGSNKKGEAKAALINSDCQVFASDSDVDKLRVRMLGEKDADGQVNEARKYFKQKCFSTTQVKSLSSLFRNDDGRYKLLDAAYPFVSDTRNFKNLVVLLTEEYYINRFKAMVRM